MPPKCSLQFWKVAIFLASLLLIYRSTLAKMRTLRSIWYTYNSATLFLSFVISFYHMDYVLLLGVMLDLVYIYYEIIQFFYVLILKEWNIFKFTFWYRNQITGNGWIVIFIATKTPWLWLSSYLTWSSVGKALESSCKWLLSAILFHVYKVGFQQIKFCIFGQCSLGRRVHMFLNTKVCISAKFSMLKGSLWIHIVLL